LPRQGAGRSTGGRVMKQIDVIATTNGVIQVIDSVILWKDE
jgi:hypothetical protein